MISFALKLNPIIVKPLKTCLMAYLCRFFSIAYNIYIYVTLQKPDKNHVKKLLIKVQRIEKKLIFTSE